MVNLTIDKIAVSVPEGTTILEAAASVGIEIPSLCYLKDINEISACRVCCVEVEGEGKLVPSCNNVVQEGMVIHTNTPRVREARRTNVELILSQHDNKCATCVRSGSCQLQKISNDLGVLSVPYKSDLAVGKKSFWTTTFPLYRDINKCIKCMRCVQVCDKMQGVHIWDLVGTGSRTTVGTAGAAFRYATRCSRSPSGTSAVPARARPLTFPETALSRRRTVRCAASASPTVPPALCASATTQPKRIPLLALRAGSRSFRSLRQCVQHGAKPSACRPARQPSVSWCPFCASWAQIMCSTPRFPPI